MVTTALSLLEDLRGVYAYTESDEISVLFRPEWELFDREVEKVVSVSAGVASAAFTHVAGKRAAFDSRVWIGVSHEQVIEYFHWRQNDAARNALNGYCYWTLRHEGRSATAATSALKGMGGAANHEFLFARNVNFNDLPLWQRRGSGVSFAAVTHRGIDAKQQREVVVTRRRLRVDREPPTKDEYSAYLRALITPPTP